MKRILLSSFFFLAASFLVAQEKDSVSGVIKVSKKKDERVYIKAFADFSGGQNYFQPFPVVEGYEFPFSYRRYFTENFKNEKIDLKEKSRDTVKIEVKITAKGKAYFDYGTDRPSVLEMQCLNFLKQIKEWLPGYVISAEKGVFKNQTVIKPTKTNVSSTGTITVFFSAEPFE